MEGWVKIYRQITEHELWTCEPFSRGQAWIDLILLANFDYSYFYKRGVKIEVQRGQVGRSEVELSARWKWSRTKVKNYLNMLKKEQQILIEKSAVTMVVTILNYDIFQQEAQQPLQQKCSRSAAEVQQKNTLKECKEDKECKRSNKKDDFLSKIIAAFQDSYFDFFQTEYVVTSKGKERTAAGAILKLYKSKYPDSNSEETLAGLSAYFKKCCSINDSWLSSNMSLSIIVSKFNEINQILKNGKSRTNSKKIDTGTIGNIVDAVFAAKGA